MFRNCLLTLITFACLAMTGQPAAFSDETRSPPSPDPAAASGTTTDEDVQRDDPLPTPLAPLPEALQKVAATGIPLNPLETVLLDRTRNRVLLRTQVACEDCLLEMLCCTEQTKEHESLLWFRGRASTVHAGLLALGAKPGQPVTFSPEFKPPTGQKINLFVNWVDADGKLQRKDARTWMRTSVSHYFSQPLAQTPPGIQLPLMELRYDPFNKEILWYGAMSEAQRDKLLSLWDDKAYQSAIRTFYRDSQSQPMTAEFVFAGSYHITREETGEKFYAAEDGYLICVANFAAALLDVKEASSASDGGQLYEGWTGRVPARGTPVIVELVPDVEPTKEL